jgi:hypothetical protein
VKKLIEMKKPTTTSITTKRKLNATHTIKAALAFYGLHAYDDSDPDIMATWFPKRKIGIKNITPLYNIC